MILNRAVHDHSELHNTEGVLANKFLFAGGPPENNFLFAGGPPANNLFLNFKLINQQTIISFL